MNENAKKWVAALRSGEYRQTQGILQDSNGFCCLGVACDLYAKEHPEARWMQTDNGVYIFNALPSQPTTSVRSGTILPAPVQQWLGLTSADGELAGIDESLLLYNDRGTPFEQIAHIIESKEAELFNEG